MSGTSPARLEVRELTVTLPDGSRPVRGVSLDVAAGEIHALVGPSGSGKSLTARALARLLPPGAAAGGFASATGPEGGSLVLVGDPAAPAHRVRGRAISYVPQQAGSALHPGRRIAAQARAVARAHGRGGAWQQAAVAALRWAGLSDGTDAAAERGILRAYPHQLSGGQQQRALLALAELCRPWVSVPDEVTTGLDPEVRDAVLGRMRERADTERRPILLITHDIGLVERWADRVTVLRDGRTAETGPVREVLAGPRDPFTRQLLADRPARSARPRTPAPRTPSRQDAPVLAAVDVTVRHPPRRRGGPAVTALDAVGVSLGPAEALAVVGASGSGKSTLLRCLAGLQSPDGGEVRAGPRRTGASPVQLLFQDALSSLDPRWPVARLVAEPLRYASGSWRGTGRRVGELLESVGLPAGLADRRAAELSGGQLQRVAVARALAADPAVLLCDEPTTNLDLTAQAGVVRLLDALRRERGLATVFVTHDLALVPHVADRVLVMAEGRVVEETDPARLRESVHPATRRLLAPGGTGAGAAPVPRAAEGP
ncbi:ATP-binding cassette domain-containing protein [Streptomyces sp. NPDC047002]|uniref:ABC transporter ATP-binding protein n=1 Tax=Streptomyces sp. NPDC047002 TaxID=3155475 RepID=UPI003456CB13